MTDSKTKISYLGIPGSYSHQAAHECFPEGSFSGFTKFDEVIKAADSGDADYAIIPVENSSAGRVTEVYNLLPSVKLNILGEHLLPIHHCLLVSYKAYRGWLPHEMEPSQAIAWKESPLSKEEKEEALSKIKQVHSHSQALLQCTKYLEEKLPKAGTVVDFDTATAARALAQKEDKKHAAIASRHAADIYNLLVVDDEIVDDPYNMTRFLILGRGEQKEYDEDTPMLTSILFQTNHTPGSLLGALKAFADNNVNLTKLETYMLSRDLTDPTFYVDVGTALHHPDMQAALKEFKKYTTSCNILGSYPASPHRGEKNSFLPVKAK